MLKNIFITCIAGLGIALSTVASPISPANTNDTSLPQYGTESSSTSYHIGNSKLFPQKSTQNADERCSHTITVDGMGNNLFKTEYSYNDEGYLIEEVYWKWSPERNDWDGNSRYTYGYDQQGRNILYISYDWSSANQIWVYQYKAVSEFNASGKQTLSAGYDWNKSSESWICAVKSITEYDSNDNPINQESYEYSREIGKLIGRERKETFYDSMGLECSQIGYDWSIEKDIWEPDKKQDSKHNSSGKWIESQYYDWDGNEWIIYGTAAADYDSNGNQTFFENCNYNNGEISSGYREYTTYDNLNRKIHYLQQNYSSEEVKWYNSYTEETEYNDHTFTGKYYGAVFAGSHSFCYWYEISKTEGTLDDNGNVTTLTYYQPTEWYERNDDKEEGKEYEYAGKKEYAYDSYGNVVLFIDYNAIEGQLIPDTKEEAAYDEEGRDLLKANYKWSTESDSWIGIGKGEYSYYDDGTIKVSTSYSWSDETGDWVGYKKSENTYEDNLLVCETSYEWMPEINDWYIYSKIEHTFNSNGTPNQDFTYSTTDGKLKLNRVKTYYYGENTGITSISRPSSNFTIEGRQIIFNGDDLKEIYTVSGMKIYQGNAQSVQLPSHGIYLISVANETFKITVR